MVWWAFPCAEVAGFTMSMLYTKRIRKNIISKMTPRDAEGNPIMFDWSAIQIDTDADWNTPGVYEVKITFTDEAANLSNFTRCYVVVY